MNDKQKKIIILIRIIVKREKLLKSIIMMFEM
jgi:hypothetical protein